VGRPIRRRNLGAVDEFLLGTPPAECTFATRFTMTVRQQHHVRRSGACFMQAWQRPGAPRPAVVSVWNKKAGSGHQN
jgi:hypothetical protein